MHKLQFSLHFFSYWQIITLEFYRRNEADFPILKIFSFAVSITPSKNIILRFSLEVLQKRSSIKYGKRQNLKISNSIHENGCLFLFDIYFSIISKFEFSNYLKVLIIVEFLKFVSG